MKTSSIFERMVLIVMLTALILLTGCSDEQKSDAARIEQEMLEREGGTEAADTNAVDTPALAESDVAAIPQEEPEPEIEIGSGYSLQVASCSDQAYSVYLVDRYISRGYVAYATPFDIDGQTFFRVRLGPYESEEQAQNLKVEILDKYSIEGWVVVE